MEHDKPTSLTLEEALRRPTLSVPEAGAVFFNLPRNSAYEAARRGDIPTIKIGGRILVPVAPIAAKLGLRTTIGSAA